MCYQHINKQMENVSLSWILSLVNIGPVEELYKGRRLRLVAVKYVICNIWICNPKRRKKILNIKYIQTNIKLVLYPCVLYPTISAFGQPRKYPMNVQTEDSVVIIIIIFMHCTGDNFLFVTINPPVIVPPVPTNMVIAPVVAKYWVLVTKKSDKKLIISKAWNNILPELLFMQMP